MPRRSAVIRTTSTDDDDEDGHIEVVFRRKSAATTNTTRVTSFPVGLGSRPPCLGQECSPVRSTPCGAGRETGSSAATAGTTSGGSLRVVPPGRGVDLGRRVGVFAGRGPPRRRSTPSRHHPGQDDPSPAAVQQSYRKVYITDENCPSH